MGGIARKPGRDAGEQAGKRILPRGKPGRKAAPRPNSQAVQQQAVAPEKAQDMDLLGEDGLTGRQRAFVEAYLGPARLNATEAAKLAGYSGNRNQLHVIGHRTLLNATVQARVRARLAGFGVDRKLVLERIGVLAGASMADLLGRGKRGQIVLDLNKAAEAGALGNIREWTQETRKKSTQIRIKTHDPRPYLELLAKHLGLIGGEPGAGNPDGVGDVSKLTLGEIAELYRQVGAPVPASLQPAGPVLGSGLVDEKGQAVQRISILEEQEKRVTNPKEKA